MVVTVYKRSGIKYRASTAILCKAGSDLGNTCHGHHDFQLSDDVLHKVHIGHYTFYSKAVVKNSKLMIRAPGVFARKYIGGEGRTGTRIENVPETQIFSDVMHEKEIEGGGDPNDEVSLPGGSLYSQSSDFGAQGSKYFIRGTCYTKDGATVTSRTLNSYGFGESTYPGCKYAREGRGLCLEGSKRTIESMI